MHGVESRRRHRAIRACRTGCSARWPSLGGCSFSIADSRSSAPCVVIAPFSPMFSPAHHQPTPAARLTPAQARPRPAVGETARWPAPSPGCVDERCLQSPVPGSGRSPASGCARRSRRQRRPGRAGRDRVPPSPMGRSCAVGPGRRAGAVAGNRDASWPGPVVVRAASPRLSGGSAGSLTRRRPAPRVIADGESIVDADGMRSGRQRSVRDIERGDVAGRRVRRPMIVSGQRDEARSSAAPDKATVVISHDARPVRERRAAAG